MNDAVIVFAARLLPACRIPNGAAQLQENLLGLVVAELLFEL